MRTILLIPPVAVLIVFLFMLFQLAGLKLFSSGLTASNDAGRRKAYACGEDVKDHRFQPNYKQFFYFAFFFTIMHVVSLVVATVPAGSMYAVAIAAFYLVAAAIGLFILLRR